MKENSHENLVGMLRRGDHITTRFETSGDDLTNISLPRNREENLTRSRSRRGRKEGAYDPGYGIQSNTCIPAPPLLSPPPPPPAPSPPFPLSRVRIPTQLSASARSDSFGGGNEAESRLPPHPHAYILFSLFIYSDCRWSRATLRNPYGSVAIIDEHGGPLAYLLARRLPFFTCGCILLCNECAHTRSVAIYCFFFFSIFFHFP